MRLRRALEGQRERRRALLRAGRRAASTLGDGSQPQGLLGWGKHCRIDHAVAESPMEPFEVRDTALAEEAHNAAPIRAPNGSFLIFDIWDFLFAAEAPEGP